MCVVFLLCRLRQLTKQIADLYRPVATAAPDDDAKRDLSGERLLDRSQTALSDDSQFVDELGGDELGGGIGGKGGESGGGSSVYLEFDDGGDGLSRNTAARRVALLLEGGGVEALDRLSMWAATDQLEAAQALLGQLIEERVLLREAREELLEASQMEPEELVDAIDAISQQYTPFGSTLDVPVEESLPADGEAANGEAANGEATNGEAAERSPAPTRRAPSLDAALGDEEDTEREPGSLSPAASPTAALEDSEPHATPVRLSLAERTLLSGLSDEPQVNALLEEVQQRMATVALLQDALVQTIMSSGPPLVQEEEGLGEDDDTETAQNT